MKKIKMLNEADIDGIDELVYNPVTGPGGKIGFGFDKGNKKENISWKGHDDHLHIAFTKRDVAMAVIDKAIELGLYVGENAYPNNKKTPKSGHSKSSFHYKEFEGEPRVSAGADIQGKEEKIEELIRWVIEKYGKGPFEYRMDKISNDNNTITISKDLVNKIIQELKDLKKQPELEKTQMDKKNISGLPAGSNENFFINEKGINLKDLGKNVNLDLKQNTGLGKKYDIEKYKELKQKTNIRWAVYNIDSNQLLGSSSNGVDNIYGASVSKVVVAAAALDKTSGELKTNEYQDLIKLLVKSDNSVWNEIQNLAGGSDEVDEWSKLKGYNMKPGRKNNLINAVDMCKFWSDTYKNKYNGSDTIIRITSSTQTSKGKSLSYLPVNVSVGGKTGSWKSYNHDSVWLKNNKGLYSITILTDGSTNSNDIAQMFGGLYEEYCI